MCIWIILDIYIIFVDMFLENLGCLFLHVPYCMITFPFLDGSLNIMYFSNEIICCRDEQGGKTNIDTDRKEMCLYDSLWFGQGL